MKAFEDPDHQGNQSEYYTGQSCAKKGCTNPAGTAWSPYWCFGCNVKRMRRLTRRIDKFLAKWSEKRRSR